jgi:magnesium chelatase subunit D
MADALESAALFRKSGQRSLLIDTSQRTSPQVAELAQAMHAQYLALPRADAHVIRHAVQLHR